MKKLKFIKTFSQIDKDDVGLVGGKGANLGEMAASNLPVPDGFVLTSKAYFQFLEKNHLKEKIRKILELTDKNKPESFTTTSKEIQRLIVHAEISKQVAKEIFIAYEQLVGLFGKTKVAIRSSATAEDLPEASFAGQQASFLNVQGEANLIEKVRLCWASLFTPRAIFYRQEKGFDHLKVGIAAVVQKMVQSEASGVMFTINPVTNDKQVYIIEAIWGLGELIVQGAVTPDHYEVAKNSFKILKKVVSKQKKKLVQKGKENQMVKVAFKKQGKQKISNKIIKKLAKLGKRIHQHYFFPQDIEWAVEKDKVYILQTRAVTTVESQQPAASSQQPAKEKINLPLIIKGDPASPGIASGYARIIHSPKEISKVKKGEVLVTSMTTPDFVPAMRKVCAIVTDKGGQTSHAAIVSRELGLPCVVGTQKATKIIKTGRVITVNGKSGAVFKGGFEPATSNQQPATSIGKSSPVVEKKFFPVLRTATKIYVNLAEPDLAAKIARQNIDGVGLLRAEFMIAQIGIHPRKLIAQGKQKTFIEKLSKGVLEFCRQFSPRPVVYRATDFKTAEYANLKGGSQYESKEANPMIGFRGAFRYITDEAVFALEIKAIKEVRDKFGFRNLCLMIPFVRTVEEMSEVKKIISSYGLHRSSSFKLWMMVEVPSNVILLEDFIKIGIDGVSIGSNDLTMLLLGLDRDNEKVAKEFDERNKAVLWALERVIKTCKKHRVSSSICGQAPSRYPRLVEKLVNWGITSISVSPDVIDSSREIVYKIEKKLAKNGTN